MSNSKKLLIWIGILIIIFGVNVIYHSYKKNKCVDEMGITYQTRMVDAKTDTNPEQAVKFANDQLSIDMELCQFE